MFRISRTKTLFRIFLAVIFVVSAAIATVIISKDKIQKDSYATTDDGATVSVSPNGKIYYDDWSTNNFSVSSGGKNFQAYCAQPAKSTPTGNWSAILVREDSMKYNMMKLIMYIHQYSGANQYVNSAKRAIFDSWPDVDNTKDRYAWTHAIIGAIYDNDYTGVDAVNRDYIQRTINILQTYINDDSNVWALAKNFQLYRTNGGNSQDIVWIEDATTYGQINIKKCDIDTRQCTPQGNANLSGIEFQLINASGQKLFNPRTGNFYNDGDVILTAKTNSNGELSFNNLLADDVKYTVRESATNTTYTLTATPQSVTLSKSGQVSTLTFYDKVNLGNLTVNKIDKDTGTCNTSGEEITFEGTTFQLINTSTNSIYYNGNTIAKNGVVDTKTLAAGQCSVQFNNLPYGSYQIKETKSGKGYVLDSTPKNVTIPTNGSNNVTFTFENQPVRGDVKFVKMDENNEKPMANVIFSISALDKNMNVKETHILVTDKNGVINTSSSFALHSKNTNGYDSLYDSAEGAEDQLVFAGYGTWFGLDRSGKQIKINDNVGALPYGTYLIQELRCDGNIFCTNMINQKQTIQITEANQVVDLGDWNNTCSKFELGTTATDNKDGDKFIEVGKKVEIKDTVSYCAKKNMTFTIKGVLMDKETKEPLLIDGKPLEQSIEFKPEQDCGEIEMIFTFDASKLAGKEVVVFESLYYKESLLVSHEDIENEDQTVELISLHTYAVNRATNEKILPLGEEVEVKDTVDYCLKPGLEYTIKGVMMDKRTGNGLLVNSKPVESEITFTPEKACGKIDMFYKLNTKDLGGAEIVIFESLYLDGQLLVEHRDIENADETVVVELPVPETGFITGAFSGGHESDKLVYIAGIAIFGIVGYLVIRYTTKRISFKHGKF